MRIPYIINKNTYIAYQPSPETLQLIGEVGRQLVSEDLQATDGVPTLVHQCIRCISVHFEQRPIINELILCADRDLLLEILPVDLPLSLVIPLIEEEIYWKRRYTESYGISFQHLHYGWTWKCIFLEKYMSQLIEDAQPEYNDEETMEDVTILLNVHVHRLVINQLQCWKPPLTMEQEDIPDILPIEHINLEPIFRRLNNIEELVMKYGLDQIGDKFTWNSFKVSLVDAKRLSKALQNLKNLKTFTLHSSNLEDSHIQVLSKGLIKVTTLEELEISNCMFGDNGAMCIAKLLMSHPKLKKLVMVNNSIGAKGGQALGFALMQESCCPIMHLNLRLNPLGHDGIMGLFRALVRVQLLEELILSGCGFEDETSIRLGPVIILNSMLKHIDVSNNWLRPGEMAILDAVKTNNTLERLDLRETDMSPEVVEKIKRKLTKNRKKTAKDDDEEEEVDSYEEMLNAMEEEIEEEQDEKSAAAEEEEADEFAEDDLEERISQEVAQDTDK